MGKRGKKPGVPGPNGARRRHLMRLRFVEQYVGGGPGVAGNATQSALRAGLATTRTSASVHGHYMLKDPKTQELIERHSQDKECGIERAARELSRIGTLTARQIDEVVRAVAEGRVDELDPATQAIVAGMKVTQTIVGGGKSSRRVIEHVEVRAWDKIAALGLLAKIRGWLAPVRAEVSGPDGGPLVILPASPHRVVVAEAEGPAEIVDGEAKP